MANANLSVCPICKQLKYLEGHHIIPISYGGPVDGKMINICESCHFAIHKTAESLMAKTVKGKNWFSSEEQLKIAAPYVQAIIEAKRDMMEGNNPALFNKPVRRMFQVWLSKLEMQRLHKVKRDRGYKNLDKFIEDLLRSLTKF